MRRSHLLVSGRVSRRSLARLVVAMLAVAVPASVVPAATRTWTGAVNQVFGTVGNWNTGVPDASDTALWNGSSTANLGISLASAQAVYGLQLTSPAGGVSLGGSTLTLGAGGIEMSAATQNLSITSNLTLGGGQAWNVAAGQTLALSTGTFTRAAGTALSLPGAGSVTTHSDAASPVWDDIGPMFT